MRPILPGSKWRCLLLHTVFIDALTEVMSVYPYMKLKVFVDDITVLIDGRNAGRNCGTGPKGNEKGRGGEGSQAVDYKKREKERVKSLLHAVIWKKLQEYSIGLANSVETLGWI